MFLEVRSGEGGDDAVGFAKELFAALVSYMEKQKCPYILIDSGRTLKAEIKRDPGLLETLVGTHRIQRTPGNDSRGRRHTSTVTVALVESFQSVLELKEKDLNEEFTKGTGNGGQNRNKLATAVRLTHLPTGLVVWAERQRNLEQNRQEARSVMKSRLQKQDNERLAILENESRRSQFLAGDRPARSFTWTKWRNEVVDHDSGRRWRYSDAIRGKFSNKP